MLKTNNNSTTGPSITKEDIATIEQNIDTITSEFIMGLDLGPATISIFLRMIELSEEAKNKLLKRAIAGGADYKPFFLNKNPDLNLMQRLMSCGADVKVQQENYTALHAAMVSINAEQLIPFLIEQGVDVNCSDELGTPLHLA